MMYGWFLEIELDSGSGAKEHCANLIHESKEEKYLGVCHALTNNCWMHFYSPYTQEKEIKEFISLWQGINSTYELNDLDNTILWRWTTVTVQVVHTKFSSQRIFVKSKFLLPGRRELSQNIIFSHGPCCITEFWLRTTYKSRDGLAIQFVVFTTYHRKLCHI
jgi:hypothetical protein